MVIRRFHGRTAFADEPPPVIKRLFCFPYAGAGGAIFRRWPDHLPADVEVCVPGLPGRDARLDEPPAAAMGPLIASLAREMLGSTDPPYALFGHSMGAFIAFDLARELSRLGRPPSHLLVSAQRGPQLPHKAPPIFDLPDDQFLAGVLARFANIPKQVLEQKELMAVLLRTLRADFTLTEAYRYRAIGRLPCPITAFGGDKDRHIVREDLAAWAAETTNRFRLYLLPGGHFFLDEAREELLTLIRRALAA